MENRMANEIQDAFNAVYADGPVSIPDHPKKSEIRGIVGATIQQQVDSIRDITAAGINWLPASSGTIRVRATGNVAIATALENGDTLNGVTLATGDHVFLPYQTLPAQNGLYTVVASGAASRATFADSAAELAHIGFVIQAGTAGLGERWTLPLAAADITVGTTPLAFALQGIEPGYAPEVEEARGTYPALGDRLDANEAATGDTNALLKGSEAPDIAVGFADKFGFLVGRMMTNGALLTTLFDLNTSDYPGFVITDKKGFVIARFSGDGSSIIGLSGGEATAPSDIVPYFAPKLVGWENEPLSIYLAHLFANIADADRCRVTIMGESGSQDSGEVVVRVVADDLGSTATLTARPRIWDGGTRASLPLTVAVAPNPPGSSTSPVIATFGDSITQASGALLIKEDLEGRGYTPSFVGTRTFGGVLTEGRSGWEIGDFTYAVTDKVTPVADADFPAYLAMSEDDKLDRNPFIRPSTGGDDPGDINNGYILDFTRYQTLSSTATPTVVLWGTGTNDVRDRSPDEIYSTTRAGDMLMYRRMHAAWPSVKILRWFPIVARSPDRDALWPKYISMMRGAMDAITDYGDAKVILVPTWTSSNSDDGFDLAAATPDPTTGVILTTLLDDIHPRTGARAEMFRFLSAYIAAAARNLI